MPKQDTGRRYGRGAVPKLRYAEDTDASRVIMPSAKTSATEACEHGGVVYQLQLSSKKTHGYKCVEEVRPGEFHAKTTLVKSGGQVTLPGPACKTAREAALRLAMHIADPKLIIKQERARRGEGKVRAYLACCRMRMTCACLCATAEAEARRRAL